jgi:GNAT superfamily N-acetyltransferase
VGVTVPSVTNSTAPDDRLDAGGLVPRSSRELSLARIERTYDAIPRAGGAIVETVGPFDLFLPGTPGGWPLYARPRLGVTTVTAADVAAVRERQRHHGVPEAIEWVRDVTPGALDAVRTGGLPVVLAPLMVLDPLRLPEPTSLTPAELVRLDPDSPEYLGLFAASSAVASLGFGAEGTAVGAGGPLERDAILAPVAPERVERISEGSRTVRTAEFIARTARDGVLARGAYQGAFLDADGTPVAPFTPGATGSAEIVGVATLPARRRQGLGAAVSAFAAQDALARGYELVFLGAASEDVARVYARIGFVRVGTACIAEASSH